MEIVAITFFAGIFGIIAGGISLKLRSKTFTKSVIFCPTCRQKVIVSADPVNSRMVLQCHNDECGDTSFRKVRSSALSLLGLARLVLVFLVTTLFYLFAEWLDWNWWIGVSVIVGGMLAGWIVISFLIRFIAHVLLGYRPSPIFQSEIVAYLAPPSFWQGQENKVDLPNMPVDPHT